MRPIIIRSTFINLGSFRYICELIFTKWFKGHYIKFEFSDRPGYEIVFDEDKKVQFQSLFFDHIMVHNIDKSALQFVNIKKFKICPQIETGVALNELTIIFNPSNSSNKDQLDLTDLHKIDFLGMCFFLVARVEEYVSPKLDKFGRHSGRKSIAAEYGFLNTPLVDIYSNILIGFLNEKLSTRFISRTEYNIQVSCDVDNPYLFDRGLRHLVKKAGADLLLRRDPTQSLFTLIGACMPKKYSVKLDPFVNGIDFIIKENNALGNKVRFNFIPYITDARYDGFSKFGSEEVKGLIKYIHDAGHLIGLHPGFNTFDNLGMMRKTTNIYRQLQRELLSEHYVSGRQHYLRWRSGVTENLLDTCGVNEDSSLGYADTGGFRCGTSRPHNLYDVKADRETGINELPLIVMETTYFGVGYLNLREEEILDAMINMKNWCKMMSGTFSILWHNCGLQSNIRRNIYKNILKA